MVHSRAAPLVVSVAALCLLGQPFGFTPEEASLMATIAKDFARVGVHYPETVAGVQSIAAKIRALLPPTP